MARRSFVPTPSVAESSTGSLYPLGSAKAPENEPIPPIQCSFCVLATSGFIASTKLFPASISTPASLYEIIVFPISQDEGGGYLARYKDFPYIMGDGESEQEAINDAKKAFSFVIETDLKEGKFIKEPSNENEKVRVNVVLPRFVLDEMKARNLNRSQFLTNLAVEALSI